MVYPITKRTLFSLFGLFVKEVTGIENFPKNGAFVLVSNHVSYIDSTLLIRAVVHDRNKKVHFIANAKSTARRNFFWYVFGGERLLKRWAGVIPLHEENKREVLDDAMQYLKKGEIVGIFPNPKMHPEENKMPKTGVARLVLRAKVPLIPVGISGTYGLLPFRRIIPKRFKRIVKLKIGKPINLEQYYDKTITRELLRKITNEIMGKVEDLVEYW